MKSKEELKAELHEAVVKAMNEYREGLLEIEEAELNQMVTMNFSMKPFVEKKNPAPAPADNKPANKRPPMSDEQKKKISDAHKKRAAERKAAESK